MTYFWSVYIRYGSHILRNNDFRINDPLRYHRRKINIFIKTEMAWELYTLTLQKYIFSKGLINTDFKYTCIIIYFNYYHNLKISLFDNAF